MELPLFTESEACRQRRDPATGATCNGCRSSGHFRKSLLVAYALPGDDINFDCPHGVPWVVKPGGPVRAVRKKKGLPGPGDVMKMVIENAYHIEQTSCFCGKVQAWMNERGWLWCLTHKRRVFEKVLQSAAERGYLIDYGSFWKMHRQMRRRLKASRKG